MVSKGICLINVKYSDNLGDGVISECLEQVLGERFEAIKHIDLGGKNDYPETREQVGKGTRKTAILTALKTTPKLAKYLLFIPNYLAGRRIAKRYQLDNIEHVVIGGGQLFSDAGSYFPARIYAICQQIAAVNPKVKFYLYGVGVSPYLGPLAQTVFKRLFSRFHFSQLLVRDEKSRQGLNRFFGLEANKVLDPALFSSKVYPVEKSTRVRKQASISVMDPQVLQNFDPLLPQMFNLEFYYQLNLSLSEAGFDCEFFTNGSAGDYQHLQELQRYCNALQGGDARMRFATKFKTPEQLCRYVGQQDLIIAHRLHANIIAYSYGVPSIGLPWDAKLSSFFELTGRAKFSPTMNHCSVVQLCLLIEDIFEHDLPKSEVVDTAWGQVSNWALA